MTPEELGLIRSEVELVIALKPIVAAFKDQVVPWRVDQERLIKAFDEYQGWRGD